MKVPTNKIEDIFRFYLKRLEELYNAEEAKQLLYTIMDEFAGAGKLKIFTAPEATLNESELLKIHFAVKSLMKSVPVQHILGYTTFYNCRIEVNQNVLIPRPETEQLVDIMLKEIKGEKKILDIGTGSGAIAIALKKHMPLADVYALDFSEKALEKARENAKLNHAEITFIHQDIMDPNADRVLPSEFDIIVSNPPYVREYEKKYMKNNVLEHEPAMALFVPDLQPLIFYECIANLGLKLLKNKAQIYVEINEGLGVETSEVFSRLKYKTSVMKDLSEKDRFIRAFRT